MKQVHSYHLCIILIRTTCWFYIFEYLSAKFNWLKKFICMAILLKFFTPGVPCYSISLVITPCIVFQGNYLLWSIKLCTEVHTLIYYTYSNFKCLAGYRCNKLYLITRIFKPQKKCRCFREGTQLAKDTWLMCRTVLQYLVV